MSRSTRVPGSVISGNPVSAARSTLACMTTSPGGPKGRPGGKPIPTSRGGETDAVIAGIVVMVSVVIPAASIGR